MAVLELKNQARKDFKRWYEFTEHDMSMPYEDFLELIPAMQWGVYVNFFDAHNIYLSSNYEEYMDGQIIFKNYFCWVGEELLTPHKTRDESRTKGIKRATEIYNRRFT